MMKKHYWIVALTLINFQSITAQTTSSSSDSGKTVFMERCAGCHNVNRVVTGPALAGVESRRDRDWINRFIHSPRTLIQQGDKQANALFASFNKVQMPDHQDLTERDISHILSFIKSETVSAGTLPLSKPLIANPKYLPIPINNLYFFGTYLLLVIVLGAALLGLVRVKAIRRQRPSSTDLPVEINPAAIREPEKKTINTIA